MECSRHEICMQCSLRHNQYNKHVLNRLDHKIEYHREHITDKISTVQVLNVVSQKNQLKLSGYMFGR